jgi:hypothetical protein
LLHRFPNLPQLPSRLTWKKCWRKEAMKQWFILAILEKFLYFCSKAENYCHLCSHTCVGNPQVLVWRFQHELYNVDCTAMKWWSKVVKH